MDARLSVRIVGGDDPTRDWLRSLLRELGWEIDEVVGRGGLGAMLLGQRVDLLLVLPDEAGAVRAPLVTIRKAGYGGLTVVLAPDAAPSLRHAAIALGVHEVVDLCGSPDALRARLQALVTELWRAQDSACSSEHGPRSAAGWALLA